MAKVFPEIDDRLRAFIEAQQLFFVATAPAGAEGHINCSPKGLDAFRVLGPTAVAYLDYVGSGVETIAHIRQNGRIVVMFCAFEGAPRIVRLYGRGEVVTPAHGDFAALVARFEPKAGVRAVLRIALDRISDSCGYGVPLYRYEGERTQLPEWAERKTEAGVTQYQHENNARSIDGLPGLDPLD
jgi:hypothetical protein